MSERLNSIEVKNFLKDICKGSKTTVLEEGKEKNELLESARKRGIIISKDDRDLGVIKSIFCFTSKANSNKARLPKKEFIKIFPQIVGRPMSYAHNRQSILGFYIDYKYTLKDEKAITYSIFFKASYPKLWEKVKYFQKKKKLSSSYEIWSPMEKREILADGTYYLHDMAMAGGALIFEEFGDEPAFKDAKVLNIASKEIQECIDGKCLVCASKYKEDEIITAEDYFRKSVEENLKKLQEEKKTKEQPKKVEPKIIDVKLIKKPKVEDKKVEVKAVPKPETKPDEKKVEPKVEEKKEIVEEKKPEPQSSKIKCSNCGEEMDYNGVDVKIKCSKCFAILNKEGAMQYPPQVKDFKVLCPSCKISNWLILSRDDKEMKIKCESCSKEYQVEFKTSNINTKEILDKFNFLYVSSVRCYQCGTSIPVSGTSTLKERKIKCPKCGLEFSYDISYEQYKEVKSIQEIKVTKSSEKGGTKTMEFKIEKSKYHRYINDYDKVKATLPNDYGESTEVAKRMTKKIPDNEFAVIVRVKDKKSGKIRTMKMFPLSSKKRVKKILVSLDKPEQQKTLKRLGVSVDKVRAKVLKRAKQFKMTELIEKYEKSSKKKVECSCVECGHKVTSEEHCVNLKCSICGGQMRRANRPGDGKPEDKKKAKVEKSKEQPKAIKIPKAEGKTEAKETPKAKDAPKTEVKKPVKVEKKETKTIVKATEIVNKEETLRAGVKKLANQVIELKKKVELYKTNAKKVIKRQTELGEFAKDLTDDQLLNDKDFEIAQLKKKVADKINKEANIEVASEVVGDKKKDGDYYSATRKEIDKKAFPEDVKGN